MKEIIDQILDGKFDYDNVSLDFSRSQVDITILPGESYEGSFVIHGPSNKLIEGFVFSSDNRMKCLCNHFSGNNEEIAFIFKGNGMEAGEHFQGTFSVISNQGEYELPFYITVSSMSLESSVGSIPDLLHFTNLAKSNWEEAVELFYNPSFGQVLNGADAEYLTLYRGLSKYVLNEQNVEEFLVASQKKQRIEFFSEQEEVNIHLTLNLAQQEIQIIRNGWGATLLQVEKKGDFLLPQKKMLLERDFLGNRCSLYFSIDTTKLHAGKNEGIIRFYNKHTDIVIPIVVAADTILQRNQNQLLKQQKLQSQLIRMFLSYRAKKVTHQAWLTNTVKIIQTMLQIQEKDPVPWLFQAQLLVTENKNNEAGWTLDHAKSMILQSEDKDPALWSYYLYLTTLIRHDEKYTFETALEIENFYKRHQDNWRLAWLLLFVMRELNTSASRRWLFFQEQYQHGCNSPLMYVEAWQMIKTEPTFITELGRFEIALLMFAAKMKILTREIVNQIHYLAARKTEYPKQVFYILKVAYEMYHDSVTLMTICTLLIQNKRCGAADFIWYEEALKKDLRVTRLYEYYVYSLDMEADIDIPVEVFRYFAFSNSLDYEHTAYLYANMLRRKNEFQGLLEEVQFQMQNFVMNMLCKGRINKNLAYLYEQLVGPQMMDKEIQNALSSLLFSKMIHVEGNTYKQVVVLHPKLSQETVYILHDQRVVAPCYEKHAIIFLEDAEGNREVLPAMWEDTFMVSDRILTELAEVDTKNLGLQLYLCNYDHDEVKINHANFKRYQTIAESVQIEYTFRQMVILALLEYESSQEDIVSLNELFTWIRPELFQAKCRADAVTVMIHNESYEKAKEWIERYGMLYVEPSAKAKLASFCISNQKEIDEELLLYLIYTAYERNQYDQITLQYLLDNFEGTTKQLRNIWKTAIDNQMSVQNIGERLIGQMLFTGCYVGEKMAVFQSYINGNASLPLEKAFLARCAYDYFMKDWLTEQTIFDEIERLALMGEVIPLIGRIAFARYYVEKLNQITVQRHKILEKFLKEMVDQGMIMPWFGTYAGTFRFMERFQDRTVIEYKTRPGSKLIIHYLIQKKEYTHEEYYSKKMQNVYEGIYEAQFVLFFGEKLKYYISEEKDGKNEIVENGTLSRSDMGGEHINSRFNILNEIMIAKTLQDQNSMEKLIKEYVQLDYMQEKLFLI